MLEGSGQDEQKSKKANRILHCILRNITRRVRDMIIPLSAWQDISGIYYIQFSTPQFKKDADRLKRLQRRTKIIKWLENLPYEERLELGL